MVLVLVVEHSGGDGGGGGGGGFGEEEGRENSEIERRFVPLALVEFFEHLELAYAYAYR